MPRARAGPSGHDVSFLSMMVHALRAAERLISAARQNRYGHRDATMILIAYRRGLRVSELCALRWDQIDFG